MTIFLTLLIVALVAWKGWYAWKRGLHTYRRDRQQHDSLREYLLGNGATERQALIPFYRHALQRAVQPLLVQWQVLLVLGILIVLLVFSIQACGQKQSVATQTDLTDVRGIKGCQLLRRYAYKNWYSNQLRIPMAVSWYLTGDHVSGSNKRQNMQFHGDDDVSGLVITTQDYIQSGYDRGHMCPSGDNKWNQTAQEQSFLMTNVCPQNHNLNKNDWNDLEQLCRTWAKKYGKVYIVCGPILRGSQHKTIGRQRNRRITVPEAFYKVMLRTGKQPAAIGFVYENHGKSQPMKQAVRSVDEIERLTGIDFFHALDDVLETKIESKANLNDWQ